MAGETLLVHDFLGAIDTLTPEPVYLFCPWKNPRGRAATFEPVLAERAIERIVKRFVEPSLRDLAYAAFYADETEPGEIVSLAMTLPFLTDYRVLLVQNADCYAGESAARVLLRYLESPSPTTIVMFVADRVDRRSKFFRACEKAGQIIECPELRESEAAHWVVADAKSRGKAIAPAAVRELIDRAGSRLSDIINAITVVCHYVGQAESIALEDVRAACADVAEEEIWALTDAIAASDTDKAVRALRAILDMGTSEFEVLGAVNWLLKTAYAVARGGESAARIKEFQAQKVRPLAQKIGLERFRNAFAVCMDAEVLFRSTGVDRALALELLVLKLAAPTGDRRAARRV